MMEQIAAYFTRNADSYFMAVWEHICISIGALLIAVTIGVPAGMLCVRLRRGERWIMALFQVLRIVPSLAVLLLLVPIMGTGVRPAIVALVILAIPSVLMNTAAGLSGVSGFMLETASGCGMRETQIWLKVRLPLAMPMVLAGIKTAFIEIIASATLAAKIGAGGLGEIIFTGLGLSRFDLLFIGGLTVAALSVMAGLLMELVERACLPYKHI